ncbi:4-hydroxybenzoate octaprenyltransferase [Hahella aquimaris]|uniref:4-hydroxybenzoate octaprenyltransferase n=1 Tax=Hahella sp. HNIBRBA332 TaxID=3015983 RepID=UPI00273CD0BC|nr:4-hydroxybenzoate octaprenyltransferase [Hahella sp. HNIBRBA332]WLQ17461.1 4-hydroxybenzoate octaprenyltransferase [Hahella sp. HNIBRBA332]
MKSQGRPLPSLAEQIKAKLPVYIDLTRLNRPIGTYLLLWPTLWALWLASEGAPSIKNLFIFVVGVLLMRSAGCVINDYADRRIDMHVERTKGRPFAQNRVTEKEALTLFGVLVGVSFILVLFTNALTIYLSAGALALASTYPFMKRHTYLPQVVLGAAFAWGIPMAFAAELDAVPQQAWLLYTATVVWTVAYDTMYAMADREDDLKIGVKSTAILFGEADRAAVAGLQVLTLGILFMVGAQYELGVYYQVSLIVAAVLFVYQQHLIRDRSSQHCFKAFLNNHWVGAAVFLGLALEFVFRL